VELFRAESCQEPHNVASILVHAPPLLKPHLERFVELFERESAAIRTWLEGVGVEMVAREVMSDHVVSGITVLPYGPSLIIACTNAESWRSVNCRIRGISSAECGGFAGVASICGSPTPLMAIPTYDHNIFNLSDQDYQRGLFIHEREHLAQRFRSRLFAEASSFQPPRTEGEVTRLCFLSHIASFREEVLAYILEGNWNNESKRDLTKVGPRALYDYPYADNKFWLSQLQGWLPAISHAKHQDLLDTAAVQYRGWRKDVMAALTELPSSPGMGAHSIIRVLDCLPEETWPRHLNRMHALGLFPSKR